MHFVGRCLQQLKTCFVCSSINQLLNIDLRAEAEIRKLDFVSEKTPPSCFQHPTCHVDNSYRARLHCHRELGPNNAGQ